MEAAAKRRHAQCASHCTAGLIQFIRSLQRQISLLASQNNALLHRLQLQAPPKAKGGGVLRSIYSQCRQCCALLERTARTEGALPDLSSLHRHLRIEQHTVGAGALRDALHEMVIFETKLRLTHILALQRGARSGTAPGLARADRAALRSAMADLKNGIDHVRPVPI